MTGPPSDVLVERALRMDALITTLRDPIDRAVLEAGRGSLRVIAQDAAGLDNVDLIAAAEFGIAVTNTPDVLTAATAEFALFMMGALSRKLMASEALVREGRWGAWHPWFPVLGDEVTGKCIAIVGCGRIGRALAGACLGLDMDLLLVARTLPDGWLDSVREIQAIRARMGGRQASVEMSTLDEALPRADYVSLHVPLVTHGSRATKHLIDERRLRRMKASAHIVNTSRGAVIDEEALIRALRERWIAGAALDVFVTEPLPLSSPLLAPDLADRVRVFHHFGSGTRETRLGLDPARSMAGRCVANLLAALA